MLILDRVLRQYPATRPAWDSVGDAGFIVAAVAAGTVGAVVAGRRPRHPVGWLFLAIGAAVVITGGAEKVVAYGLLTRADHLNGAGILASLAEPLFVTPLGLLCLVLLLTPTGHLPPRSWRPVAWTAVVLPVITYVVMVLAPRQVESPFSAGGGVLALKDLT